jgi:hypothetical protein
MIIVPPLRHWQQHVKKLPMARQKSPDYSDQLRVAIEAAKIPRSQAAELIGVRLNTLDKWLAQGLSSPAPRWALELFQLKVAQITQKSSEP